MRKKCRLLLDPTSQNSCHRRRRHHLRIIRTAQQSPLRHIRRRLQQHRPARRQNMYPWQRLRLRLAQLARHMPQQLPPHHRAQTALHRSLLQGFFLRPALIGAGIQPIGQGPLRGLCPRQRTCSLQPRCVRRPVLRRAQHAPPSRTKRKTSRHRRNGGRR